MKKLNLLSLFFALCVTALHAQTRYLDEVFSQASATTTYYGNNYTVITLSQLGHTAPLPQRVDIYTPTGDTETARPLIIYLHTGNFLPTSVNGSCGGSITDSSNVEMATRLAKMGYVVAVASYRLGWRPDLPQELLKRFTLINAAYRGVQDVRSCIRYFRKTVAEAGNPYGIDPEKIVVWGQGTGGFGSIGPPDPRTPHANLPIGLCVPEYLQSNSDHFRSDEIPHSKRTFSHRLPSDGNRGIQWRHQWFPACSADGLPRGCQLRRCYRLPGR